MSLANFGNTYTSKSSFLKNYGGAHKPEGFVGFENACSRAKTYVILTTLNTFVPIL